MVVNFYLAKKKQCALLAEDGSWIDLRQPLTTKVRPRRFASVDAAKSTKKNLKETNKIGIYTDVTLYQVFGIRPDELIFRNDPSSNHEGSPVVCQEEQDEEIVGEEEDEILEFDGVSRETGENPSEKGVSTVNPNVETTMNTPLITDLEDILASMIALFDRLSAAEKELPMEDRHVNQIMQDELHFSEFEHLNVVEGYQAWLRIHNARIERRRIKNESEVVALANDLFGGFDTTPLQKALNRIEAMRHRSYAPRSDSYPIRKTT